MNELLRSQEAMDVAWDEWMDVRLNRYATFAARKIAEDKWYKAYQIREVEKKESECGKPCDPFNPCDECEEYWQRMEREGYWRDNRWTNKGWKEIMK